MTKKVKLRTDRIIILIAVIVAFLIALFRIPKDLKTMSENKKFKNTAEYKLGQKGYNEKDVQTILENMKEKQVDTILNTEYNEAIPKLIMQKYFIFDRLERYLTYQTSNSKENLSTVISIVNTNADYKFYSHTEKTDVSKDTLLLVNKHYKLDNEYKPDDIVNCSVMYAYDNNSLREDAYNAFKRLFNAAKKEGHTIIINSSYRDYEWQERLYKSYQSEGGEKYADSISARPGHSEHQTGLAIDVSTYQTPIGEFENTEAFQWMSKNAYKYGFILRFPKGKENITGYDYEPWHYRYVGEEIATEIHNQNITFDEYYEYFLK